MLPTQTTVLPCIGIAGQTIFTGKVVVLQAPHPVVFKVMVAGKVPGCVLLHTTLTQFCVDEPMIVPPLTDQE